MAAGTLHMVYKFIFVGGRWGVGTKILQIHSAYNCFRNGWISTSMKMPLFFSQRERSILIFLDMLLQEAQTASWIIWSEFRLGTIKKPHKMEKLQTLMNFPLHLFAYFFSFFAPPHKKGNCNVHWELQCTLLIFFLLFAFVVSVFSVYCFPCVFFSLCFLLYVFFLFHFCLSCFFRFYDFSRVFFFQLWFFCFFCVYDFSWFFFSLFLFSGFFFPFFFFLIFFLFSCFLFFFSLWFFGCCSCCFFFNVLFSFLSNLEKGSLKWSAKRRLVYPV